MGLYDRVTFDERIDIPDFPDGVDVHPSSVEWQTKTFKRPSMTTYEITPEGRLLKEEWHGETVPEEERPMYDPDSEGFEKEWHEACGMLRRVTDGWTDTEYHGILEFHGSVDGEYVSYEAVFTHGDLEEIRRVD